MIGAPQRVSMPLASPFIETSSAPLVRPSAKAAAINSGRPGARPGPSNAKANASAAKRVARATPTRGASIPVIGMERTAPAAKPRRTRLSAPSDKCSRACSSAIEAAQAPIPNPLQRKMALLAARSIQGETGKTAVEFANFPPRHALRSSATIYGGRILFSIETICSKIV